MKRSVTAPDSGLFVKGEHKGQFAYEAHTARDKHGFIPEAVVTPGNVHDSVAFDAVYDRVTEAFPEAETIAADSAHKTPRICKMKKLSSFAFILVCPLDARNPADALDALAGFLDRPSGRSDGRPLFRAVLLALPHPRWGSA